MYGRKKEYVDMEIEARMWIVREDENQQPTPSTDPITWNVNQSNT
jgi:hypothetical protein